MISSLRKAAQSPILKIFLGLIVISFAALPLSGTFVGSGSSAVAVIDGQDITPQDYARAVQVELNRLGQEERSTINLTDFRTFGADQFLLNQMIHDVAVQNEARALNISLPDDVVKTHIATMPAFQGLSGQFSQDQFKSILRRNGLSTTEFINMLRNDLLHQILLDSMSTIAKPPLAVLETVAKFQEEQRQFSYVVLPLDIIEEPDNPEKDILSQYYSDNSDLYKTPEYRRAQVLYVAPDKILQEIKIEQDDIEGLYKRRIQSYKTPERRQLEQMIFDTQEEANTAVKRLLSGELFEKLATERGMQPNDINLGYVIKDDLLPEAGESAFFTDSPGIVGPIETGFGYTVINVKKIEPSITKTLDDVREALVADLRAEKISRILPDVLNVIEDSRAEGATLEEIAQENNFIFHIITLDNAGQAPDGQSLPSDLPAIDILTNDIFLAEPEEEQDVRESPSQGLYVLQVEAIIEPQQRPLSDIEDRVIEDWKYQNRLSSLKKKAADLAEVPNPFEEISEEYELPLLSTSLLKRNSDQSIFSPTLYNDLFNANKEDIVFGTSKEVDTFIISRVDSVIEPSQKKVKSVVQDLEPATANAMQQDLGILYTQALVSRQNVEVNNTAVQNTLDRIQAY